METGPWVCSASSLAMWAETETKQPALLLVKVTLGPLIWAIKGAINPSPPPPQLPQKCLAGKLWTQCFQSRLHRNP